MKTLLKGISFLVIALLLGSCSSVNIREYANDRPQFDLEQFFDGPLEGYGMFQDRSGKVIKRMKCIITGSQQNGETVIEEKFVYSDGKTENRTWRLKKVGEGQYIGTAGDVVGEAKIETSGSAFHMSYRLKLMVDEEPLEVHMDDWMYRVDENVVLNRTKMSKWGLNLGEVTFTIMKKAK